MEYEQDITCPYCWQRWTVLLDLTVSGQSYVEDCAVCCNPVIITYEADNGCLERVDAERAQ